MRKSIHVTSASTKERVSPFYHILSPSNYRITSEPSSLFHSCFKEMIVQRKRPVFRKSKHVSLVTARTQLWKKKQITTERWDPFVVCRAINVKRGWHWLQNTWSATFCCGTSWELSCSWIGQEDREPPSSTSSLTRSTTKQSLQPLLWKSTNIMDMGNVELFELFETDPKLQCKECLLYWNLGTVCCTCGHLLKENEASRGRQYTLDLH